MVQLKIYLSRATSTTVGLAFFCTLSACGFVDFVRPDRPTFLLLEVPLIKQQGNLCGPAAVAMVLSFYGVSTSQYEVAQETFTPGLKAALLSDLENYVNTLSGFRARSASLSIDGLEEMIRKGHPPIVLVDEGIGPYQAPHYMVVVGVDQSHDKIACHTRNNGNKVFRTRLFLKRWRKMNNLALIILPQQTRTR